MPETRYKYTGLNQWLQSFNYFLRNSQDGYFTGVHVDSDQKIRKVPLERYHSLEVERNVEEDHAANTALS